MTFCHDDNYHDLDDDDDGQGDDDDVDDNLVDGQ